MFDTSVILKSAEELAGWMRLLANGRDSARTSIAHLEEDCRRIEHEMERPRCKYKERAKLATRLACARRERRELKDWLSVNEPYFQWLGTDNGAKTQTMIANLVGVGRRVEEGKRLRKKAAEV